MWKEKGDLSHPDSKTNYMELFHYVNICPAYLFNSNLWVIELPGFGKGT